MQQSTPRVIVTTSQRSRRAACIVKCVVLTLVVPLSIAHADDSDTFAPVAAIFQQHCVSCHNDVDRKGELSLQSPGDLQANGLVDADDPPASHLLDAISPKEDEPPSMPQDASPLTAEQVNVVRQWVSSGAMWPDGLVIEESVVDDFDWWSFQPLTRPSNPGRTFTPDEREWFRTPIDAFILDKLLEHHLINSMEADRRTLIRRVTYDLTGLPPTPEQVRIFETDSSPLAYEQLVDRLLASPQYGEKWARHWLDVVKYADTCGYDKDKLRPHAWPYRDYVIRSFNEDKPYARFVQEQIAGDVLFPGTPDGILGLGFIAAGPWDFIGHVEVPESKIDGKVARNLDRDDMVAGTLNTFCSVTIQCARCHNHKFDPFTQEHYYGLQAVFAAVDRAERPYDLDPTLEERRASLTETLQQAKTDASALEVEIKAPDGDAQPDVQRQESLSALIKQTADELKSLPTRPLVYAAATNFKLQGNFKPTGGTPRDVHVLHRGNVQQPLAVAMPGVFPLTKGDANAFTLDPDSPEGERRAALARWLTRDDHPLVWRSIANRIWQYHFGRGLVDSPNDFGRMGQLPSHPELLDWLAIEFRDNGGSFKHLHRLIVTSAVYRQASTHDEANAEIDASNQYLWHMNRRKLSAEEIRDTLLAVSGRLNPQMSGPGYYLFELERTEHSPHYEYHKFDPTDPHSHRRAVYRFIVRSQPDPFMTTLDCADSSQSTPRRTETLTSLQALSMLNNGFNLTMAEAFASRLQLENSNIDQQIIQALTLLTGRRPSNELRDDLTDYANTHGLANLCRLLFNLSEVLFVD